MCGGDKMNKKPITKFQHEKMRLEIKNNSITHFLDETSYAIDGVKEGELISIFNSVYTDYKSLVDSILDYADKAAKYPYDEQDFREKLKKLSLFLNQVLEKLPREDKFSLFKSDITEVKNQVENQVKILENHFGKDCYWGRGEITLQ